MGIRREEEMEMSDEDMELPENKEAEESGKRQESRPKELGQCFKKELSIPR